MKKNLIKTLVMAMAFSLIDVLAFAQCVIPIAVGQSYVEDFESGQMECWTVETTGAGTWAVMTGTASNVAAFQNASAGDEARLISPTFDMSGVGSATFSFSYAMMALYNNDVLTASYRTSPTDTWHELGTYSINDWSNIFEESFTLPDISSTYQVSFLGHSNGGYYIFIDNVEITGEGGCARPVSLQATELSAFSALLGWSTTGSEESWVVELNGVEKTVETQPYLMENLEPQTDYTFRVKANCGGGLSSDWSLPFTFKTLCDVIVVTDDEPYFDDFEASDEFLCWQDEITSGDYGWAIDPGYLILNNTANFFWMGEEAILISAQLDITNVTNPTLEFKHKQPVMEGAVDFLYVAYRTSPTDSWHIIGSYEYPCNDWETVTLALPNASATYQIGFDGLSNNADGVYIDDVWVGNNVDAVAEEPAMAVSVNPNPTTGKIIVNTNISNGNVDVFNMVGKQIKTENIVDGHAEISLEEFANGVYFVKISDEKGVKTVKVVKK
ncbi:MAG: T9SS type A sorting domain-containing protein [Bacteroidales bacterium]|nr:T9SS type A sorting domain-containing protein [Bacteroidales bacterium]